MDFYWDQHSDQSFMVLVSFGFFPCFEYFAELVWTGWLGFELVVFISNKLLHLDCCFCYLFCRIKHAILNYTILSFQVSLAVKHPCTAR